MSKWRIVCAFVAVMAVASAQRAITVNELVSFIKDSIKRKQDDRLVADYLLKRMKMKEHLDEKTVETLEGLGAGPRTVEGSAEIERGIGASGRRRAASAAGGRACALRLHHRRRARSSRNRFSMRSGKMPSITAIICRIFYARRSPTAARIRRARGITGSRSTRFRSSSAFSIIMKNTW